MPTLAIIAIILLGFASTFAFHAWLGWTTGTVRFPLSVFVIEEFDRGRSIHFLPLVIINALVALVFLAAAGVVGWQLLGTSYRPITDIRALNGCYEESDSLPNSRRSHTFRVGDGVIFDQTGQRVSTIALLDSAAEGTSIGFSPGIRMESVRNAARLIASGPVLRGSAYSDGDRSYIAFESEGWPHVLNTIPCAGQ